MDAMAPPAGTIDIARVGRPQVTLIITGMLVLFTDGFDAQSVSFVAPALSAAWRLSRADIGHVFAANLFGLMIGALVVTPLADIFSRRLVTMLTIGAFGVLTLCVPLTHGVGQLAALRFVTGLALGGAMPCMIVAVSEYLPVRLRARLLAALICGFSFGLAAAGLAAALLVKPYGWTAVFWLGGILPLLTLPLVAIFLPESAVYLAARRRIAQLEAVLRRMGAAMTATGLPAASRGFPGVQLFRNGLAPITVAVWLAYFCSGTTLYFLANWLPLLVNGAGYSPQTASLAGTAQVLGGMVGGIVVGALVDRLGMAALCAVYVAAFLSIIAIGLSATLLPLLIGCTVLAGFFVIGGQNAMNAYVGGSVYPAGFRVTGLGWGLAVTRLAGVLAGSLLAAYVVSLDLPPARILLIFGLPELIAAAALLWTSRRLADVQERGANDFGAATETARPAGAAHSRPGL